MRSSWVLPVLLAVAAAGLAGCDEATVDDACSNVCDCSCRAAASPVACMTSCEPTCRNEHAGAPEECLSCLASALCGDDCRIPCAGDWDDPLLP
jgi:hypothetical protein